MRLRLNQSFSLHFFEQRYRLLVKRVVAESIASQVMDGDFSAVNNLNVNEGDDDEFDDVKSSIKFPPTFIFLPSNKPTAKQIAFKIGINRYNIYHNGTADVSLEAVGKVMVEKSWVDDEKTMLYCVKVREICEEEALG